MNVVFRTDASIEIGTGHVMRCLTLAKQLERHAVEVTFICREFEGSSISYLQSQGIKVIILPPVEKKIADLQWIRDGWEIDARETISIIKEMDNEIDLIIVDHYGLDNRWESLLRSCAKHIMVIDDLADRVHDCDYLLDQNFYINMNERYIGLVPDQCLKMLGPDYVLLRDEFLQVANRNRERTGEINNILIFFGGTDPTGETLKALEAVIELNIPEVEVNVVVGALNPKRNEIEQLCKEIPNVNFHCQINNMAELMVKADLAIGAGGTTTWERCFLGLPSLTIIVAENQIELTKAIAKEGASIIIGWGTEVGVKEIKKTLSKIKEKPLHMKDMSARCFEVLDQKKISNQPVLKKILEMDL